MHKWVIDGFSIEQGSGNVFADLGLPDADGLEVWSGLVAVIAKAIREQGLSQPEAARCMGLTQLEVAALLRDGFAEFSAYQLMTYLNRLGYDIEIQVRATDQPGGRLLLTCG